MALDQQIGVELDLVAKVGLGAGGPHFSSQPERGPLGFSTSIRKPASNGYLPRSGELELVLPFHRVIEGAIRRLVLGHHVDLGEPPAG
jgi:hypothetical protein